MRFTSKILQAKFRLKAGTQQSEREKERDERWCKVLQHFQKSDIMPSLDGYSETRVGKQKLVLIQNWFIFLFFLYWN